MKLKSLVLLSLIILFFNGCSKYSLENRINTAKNITKENFLEQDIKTSNFVLKSFIKNGSNLDTLRVYIEGDGLAWISKTEQSLDPTPLNPLALRLA